MEPLLELLFVSHPKEMLFIDEDEAKLFKIGVLGRKPMRPDDKIDRAIDQPLDHLALIRRFAESAQLFDANRVVLHPLTKVIVMLLC